jgi:nitroimidazol reductase NimA-like FMN-containing flavoprotein (pyridoxamine 5'-phosphate oxidase superfamily)
MRRSDREITAFEDIIAVLDNCLIVRLAMIDGGEPYVVPLNFGFINSEAKQLSLFFHCALEGKKITALQNNPRVCFEADTEVSLIKGEEACDWSTAYESVIGFGSAHILTSPEDKCRALDQIMKHVGYQKTPRYPDTTLERMLAIRVDVDSFTGKRHAKPA